MRDISKCEVLSSIIPTSKFSKFNQVEISESVSQIRTKYSRLQKLTRMKFQVHLTNYIKN
jgi:hypothetical protein